jgi:tetratricopeptide (TPR) repeat protein
MKRILISTALFLAATGGFAQMKLVNKALAEAKAEKPNFTQAQSEIKEALSNDESKDNAKTWYAAGFIEDKIFEAERNKQILGQQPNDVKMYDALLASYNYFMKAAELDQKPDEKGKVKPKFLKDIKSTLKNNQGYFINGGAYFWEQKDYQKAYDLFHVYTVIPKLDLFKGEPAAVDTNYNMILFYEAVAASYIPDPRLAISCYEQLKGTDFKQTEVYQYLAQECLNANDSALYLQTLQEGAKLFPKDPYFVQSLINVYINNGDTDHALAYLQDAIAQTPDNAQLYDVTGRLYEQQNDIDKALDMYTKATEHDPTYAAAWANIGRVYYNQAITESDAAANIKDMKTYNQVRAEKIDPLFKKALPYFEKAHQLDPTDREYMIGLRGIYYNLDMSAEYDKIEAEMNAL